MTVAELGAQVAELDKRLSPSAKKVLEKRVPQTHPRGRPPRDARGHVRPGGREHRPGRPASTIPTPRRPRRRRVLRR